MHDNRSLNNDNTTVLAAAARASGSAAKKSVTISLTGKWKVGATGGHDGQDGHEGHEGQLQTHSRCGLTTRTATDSADENLLRTGDCHHSFA